MSSIILVDPETSGWHSAMLIGDMQYRLIGENIHYSYGSAVAELYIWKALLAEYGYSIGHSAKIFVVASTSNQYFDIDTYVDDLNGVMMMRLGNDWQKLKRYVGEIQERK